MNKQRAIKLADDLFRKHIYERGFCEADHYRLVKCSSQLQCCHIRSRRFMAIRWADDNALCMCSAHHLYFTHHPLEWEAFCLSMNIDYDGLRDRGLHGKPQDPLEVIERLRASV